MTNNDIITRVRRQISDAVAPYRWDQDTLFRYLSDSIRAIVQDHPEALYIAAVTTADPVEVTPDAAGDDFQLDPQFANAVMHYVCYLALSEDSEDARNTEMANDHYTKYQMEGA